MIREMERDLIIKVASLKLAAIQGILFMKVQRTFRYGTLIELKKKLNSKLNKLLEPEILNFSLLEKLD